MMATITLAMPITIVTPQESFLAVAAHHHQQQQMRSISTSSQAATTKAGQKHVLELKPPRVGHKKSRKGCAQCKRRHVKCNEEAPCSNCTRHNVPCSLAGGPFVAREDSKRKEKDSRTQSNASCPSDATGSLSGRSPLNVSESSVGGGSRVGRGEVNLSPGSGDQQEQQRRWPLRISPTSPRLPMPPTLDDPIASLTAHIPRIPAGPGLINWHLDLQLMHHYMSYTKGVVSETNDQAYIVHVWKQELPKLAFAHEHVLHALLGLVALHKSTVSPDQAIYFRTCAVEHIDLAEVQFHQLLLQQHPGVQSACTVEAASARWVYRWLVLLFAIGVMQSEVAAGPSVLDGLVNVMALARGVGGPPEDDWYFVSQSAFAPILTRGWQDVMPESPLMPEGIEIELNHLEYMLGLEVMLPHERAACALAIEDLGCIQRGLQVHQQQLQQHEHQPSRGVGCSVASLVCWPRRDLNVFANMIQRRVPQALVIVSYHCVFLHALDSKWWARAWGVRVLQDVLRHLDEGWKNWVQWPVQAITYRETGSTSIVVSQSPAGELGLGAMLL